MLVMGMPAAVSGDNADEQEGLHDDDGAGVDIKIRALNLSTSDTPFCGVGGGMVGDRLKVDAFMDQDGIVTGTAVSRKPAGRRPRSNSTACSAFWAACWFRTMPRRTRFRSGCGMILRPEASRRRWSTSSCRGVAKIPCPRSHRESTRSPCESSSKGVIEDGKGSFFDEPLDEGDSRPHPPFFSAKLPRLPEDLAHDPARGQGRKPTVARPNPSNAKVGRGLLTGRGGAADRRS